MKPNLFIIGAPKCGTSSLFDWLAGHPEIRGSRPKEPFFLTDPDHPLSRRPNLAQDGEEAYETFFQPEDTNAAIRMEATTHYLFDNCAKEVIAGMADARVIVVLREPAKRVYSSFQYTKNNLARLSPSLTFRRYVSLIDDGVNLTAGYCNHPGSAFVLERDIEYSRYAFYLEPWLNALGRGRIKVVLMEDMVRDPEHTVRDICNWLGLDPELMATVNRAGRNRTEQVRMPRLQNLIRRINAHVRPPEFIRNILKRLYGALQFRKSASVSEEDETIIRQLQFRYSADNAELSRITGIDLSAWSVDIQKAGFSQSR